MSKFVSFYFLLHVTKRGRETAGSRPAVSQHRGGVTRYGGGWGQQPGEVEDGELMVTMFVSRVRCRVQDSALYGNQRHLSVVSQPAELCLLFICSLQRAPAQPSPAQPSTLRSPRTKSYILPIILTVARVEEPFSWLAQVIC